jgi:hypothetical protein
MALDEALEAAELDDMKTRLRYPAVVVELDGHFAVTFDPGDGLDGDLSSHGGVP